MTSDVLSPCAHSNIGSSIRSERPQGRQLLVVTQACFAEVITNPAEFRGGALRVAPRHALQHGCGLCPANLCKGQVRLALGLSTRRKSMRAADAGCDNDVPAMQQRHACAER